MPHLIRIAPLPTTRSFRVATVLICLLWAGAVALLSPLRASASGTAEVTTLASFADAYIAWDLPSAHALFSPDAEIFHAFDDGRVAHVGGAIRVQNWLAARAFVHPVRWSAEGPGGITVHQRSVRTDDARDDLIWYEAALLLSADLAADGTIRRLYVAYSTEGLDLAIATAEQIATGAGSGPAGVPTGAPIIFAETLSGAPPSVEMDAASSILASISVGPERGDYSWVAYGTLLTALALAAQRLGRPTRGGGDRVARAAR